MANYVYGAFGDDFQLTSGLGFDYTAPDTSGVPAATPATSSSSGDSGAGSGLDWNAIITGGLGLATGVVKAVSSQPAATPVPGLSTTTLGAGSSTSSILGGSAAILGLGALALFLVMKK